MERGQGLWSSIAVELCVLQSVLTALHFCSKVAAFEANEKPQIRNPRKPTGLTSGLRNCRLAMKFWPMKISEVYAHVSMLSSQTCPVDWLLSTLFYVCATKLNSLCRAEKGLCGSNQRHANQKVES